MPVFAVESYDAVAEEIQPLLIEHWKEIAVYKDIPLDPDMGFYEKACAAGLMTIYTVRQDDALIGYAIFIVRPHPHYRAHSWALCDIIWLHPEHRQMGVGGAFVDFWDADLLARGVNVVHVNAKVAHPALMFLLKSRKYETIECGLEKRIS